MLYLFLAALLVIVWLTWRVYDLKQDCNELCKANARLLVELDNANAALNEANAQVEAAKAHLQHLKDEPIRRGAHAMLMGG